MGGFLDDGYRDQLEKYENMQQERIGLGVENRRQQIEGAKDKAFLNPVGLLAHVTELIGLSKVMALLVIIEIVQRFHEAAKRSNFEISVTIDIEMCDVDWAYYGERQKLRICARQLGFRRQKMEATRETEKSYEKQIKHTRIIMHRTEKILGPTARKAIDVMNAEIRDSKSLTWPARRLLSTRFKSKNKPPRVVLDPRLESGPRSSSLRTESKRMNLPAHLGVV
ncbi:hypothetical protein BDQ17DRAFT_1408968 [Cyathus striatus]|nr:hypothetical protein BDQ17DRAFT_1408968 [Cyathus striatus]